MGFFDFLFGPTYTAGQRAASVASGQYGEIASDFFGRKKGEFESIFSELGPNFGADFSKRFEELSKEAGSVQYAAENDLINRTEALKGELVAAAEEERKRRGKVGEVLSQQREQRIDRPGLRAQTFLGG